MKLHNKVNAICLFLKARLFRGRDTCRSIQFRTPLFISLLFICFVAMCLIKVTAIHNSNIQEGIAKNIIRFHVIANSDSTADQALKLKIKDKLVDSLSPLLSDVNSIDDARYILSKNLDFIQKIAEESIKQYGYNYPVKVTMGDCFFPLKVYGSCTFPPGVYEALRVQIGAAEGKNWWCVMFPPLCFVDDTYGIVDETTNKKLKHLLTEEEYDSLVNQKKPIKIKFKILDSIKKLFH
jgi:stage II sporulation protein R